jgi:hypothetical protein
MDNDTSATKFSFRLTGPDGRPWVRIGTHTRLDPGASLGAPTGQFLDPHPHPTNAKPTGCRLSSLVTKLYCN